VIEAVPGASAGMADDKREAMFAGARSACRRAVSVSRKISPMRSVPRHGVLRDRLDRARRHCLRDVMIDHTTVRTHDLEGTRAFLDEPVLGRKLGEQLLKERLRRSGA
jgi:hypothetical protein